MSELLLRTNDLCKAYPATDRAGNKLRAMLRILSGRHSQPAWGCRFCAL